MNVLTFKLSNSISVLWFSLEMNTRVSFIQPPHHPYSLWGDHRQRNYDTQLEHLPAIPMWIGEVRHKMSVKMEIGWNWIWITHVSCTYPFFYIRKLQYFVRKVADGVCGDINELWLKPWKFSNYWRIASISSKFVFE